MSRRACGARPRLMQRAMGPIWSSISSCGNHSGTQQSRSAAHQQREHGRFDPNLRRSARPERHLDRSQTEALPHMLRLPWVIFGESDLRSEPLSERPAASISSRLEDERAHALPRSANPPLPRPGQSAFLEAPASAVPAKIVSASRVASFRPLRNNCLRHLHRSRHGRSTDY